MRFVLTAQAWVVVLRVGRPAAQTLGRYKAEESSCWASEYLRERFC